MTASAISNPLPDGQTAFNNLFEGAYQNVFFHKCAAAGFSPATQAEAQSMLDMAQELRLLDQSAPVKQAADANNPFFQAHDALRGVMQHHGLGTYSQQARRQEEETAIKQATDFLCANPTLYNSVLAMKLEEAENIRQTYQRK